MMTKLKSSLRKRGDRTKILHLLFCFLLLLISSACQNEEEKMSVLTSPMSSHDLDIRPTLHGSNFHEKRIHMEQIHPVVFIQTSYQNGTGFYISNDHILTAAHVIKGTVLVEFFDEYENAALGHVVGYDQSMDIALIKVLSFEQSPAPMSFSEDFPDIDDSVYLHFMDREEQGIITDVDKEIFISQNIQDSLITINIPVKQGQSGSPVTDSSSRVIGLVTARSLIDDEKTFVVPITEVIDSINEWIENPLQPKEVLNLY